MVIILSLINGLDNIRYSILNKKGYHRKFNDNLFFIFILDDYI